MNHRRLPARDFWTEPLPKPAQLLLAAAEVARGKVWHQPDFAGTTLRARARLRTYKHKPGGLLGAGGQHGGTAKRLYPRRRANVATEYLQTVDAGVPVQFEKEQCLVEGDEYRFPRAYGVV